MIKRVLTSRRRPTRRIVLPKIPALLQDQIDSLIDKAKGTGLTASEQRRLDEALDDRASFELKRQRHRR